jgi:hypothetical protein
MLTLKELQSWLETAHGLTVSIAALDKFLRLKLGFHYCDINDGDHEVAGEVGRI